MTPTPELAITHEKHGFVRTYLFSTDHKMIAKQFLCLGLFMMVLGGLMALMMRWELAWPESQVPGTRWIPEPFMTEGHMNPASITRSLRCTPRS